MAIKETLKFTHEQMYGGPEKEILMANVTITPGTGMAKGTLMTITGKTAAATTKDGNANAVLAYDIDEKQRQLLYMYQDASTAISFM